MVKRQSPHAPVRKVKGRITLVVTQGPSPNPNKAIIDYRPSPSRKGFRILFVRSCRPQPLHHAPVTFLPVSLQTANHGRVTRLQQADRNHPHPVAGIPKEKPASKPCQQLAAGKTGEPDRSQIECSLLTQSAERTISAAFSEVN